MGGGGGWPNDDAERRGDLFGAILNLVSDVFLVFTNIC